VQSTDKGLLLPRMTQAQREGIAGPATGLMVYNTTTGCLEVNHGSPTASLWRPLHCRGTIGELNCQDAFVAGYLKPGQPATGVFAMVPYTGGNGGAYIGQNLTAAGVTGLSATLADGHFANGAGTLAYAVSGIPAAAGTAIFTINAGGQSCSLSLPVAPSPGTIGELQCGDATITGTLMPQQAAVGLSASVPYTGGNGGAYGFQAIASSGLTGLTALLDAGILATGSGALHLAIIGTAPAPGLANFALDIGGQVCTLQVKAGCGAYLANNQWKGFLCHNLAAANTAADPFTPGWEINGGYWQWGQTGPPPSEWLDTNTQDFAHGPTGPNADQTNDISIIGWNQSNTSTGYFSESPCPAGFRLPSRNQWEAVAANNPQTLTGTWSQSATNYSSGIFFGSKLMLPAAGHRVSFDGSLAGRGYSGYYWSDTANTPPNYASTAWALNFNSEFPAEVGDSFTKSFGMSIRCVAE
jgi:uncharacterized protein (TIGR02145 family)